MPTQSRHSRMPLSGTQGRDAHPKPSFPNASVGNPDNPSPSVRLFSPSPLLPFLPSPNTQHPTPNTLHPAPSSPPRPSSNTPHPPTIHKHHPSGKTTTSSPTP